MLWDRKLESLYGWVNTQLTAVGIPYCKFDTLNIISINVIQKRCPLCFIYSVCMTVEFNEGFYYKTLISTWFLVWFPRVCYRDVVPGKTIVNRFGLLWTWRNSKRNLFNLVGAFKETSVDRYLTLLVMIKCKKMRRLSMTRVKGWNWYV